MSRDPQYSRDTATSLSARFGAWGEHPRYRVADWQQAVANDDTRRAYWDWVAALLEQDGESGPAVTNVHEDRVFSIVRVALDAFWAEVAAAFQKIKTGDLSPDVTHRLEGAATDAVRAWVAANTPAA